MTAQTLQALQACRANGARAVLVVCPGPLAKSEVVPVSRSLREADAVATARLGVEQASGLEGSCVSAASVLWTDPKEVEAPRRHVLAMAVGARVVEDIAGAGARAGVRVEGVLARESLLIGEAVRRLQDFDGRVTVLLWVDETETVIAIAEGARLALVRHLGVGLRALIQMISKMPLEDGRATVGTARAEEWLGVVGVPAPDDALPGDGGLHGALVLPALEPALQRIALEARQSLRFALGEGARAEARLALAGPGARVRNLAPALAARTGLPLVQDRFDGAATDVARLAVRAAARGLVVRPRARREARERVGFRAALAAGVGVVLGLGALDWREANESIVSDRAALAALGARDGEGGAPDTSAQSIARRAASVRVVNLAHEHLGRVAPCAAFLGALANATPPEITLTSARLTRGEAATIRGHVAIDAGHDASAVIHDYVVRLRACPVFAGASLAGVRREFSDNRPVQAFDITIEVVELPAPGLRALAEGAP